MANSLTHSAIVGTNNPSNQLSDADLLRQAGIRGMQRLAGYIPSAIDGELPPLADDGNERICEQSTVVQFFRLHDSSKNHLKAIWIDRFIQSGLKFPNEFLPDLLSVLGGNRFTRNNNIKYLPLMSQRVKWLAAFSEYGGWQWVLENPRKSESDSKVPMKDNFVSRFSDMRTENSHKALNWLDDNWHQFPPEWHLAFLNVLQDSLNLADEAFLASLLDANNELHEVIDKVAYLLSLLESDSVQAVIAAIIDMTYVAKTTYHGWVLDFRWSQVYEEHPVYLPAEDLWYPVAHQYSWSGTLPQLLQIVPLEYWCQHYKLRPIELVAAIYNGLHGAEFSEAWWGRLLHESREDFLRALLTNKVAGFWLKPWDASKKLIEGLPFELFQIVVDEWLNNF